MSSQLTAQTIRESISYCGLVCSMCNEGANGCPGCRTLTDGCGEKDHCKTKQCCKAKGIDGCWECDLFPCGGEMQNSHRIRAFVHCAKEDGIGRLATYLHRNACSGICYHRADGIKGDYDLTDTEEQVMILLRNGTK